MSHHRHHHHDEDHEHGHRRDRHHELHRTRLQHALARRRTGDDVTALEELQRDLEQAAADVAARIEALRAKSSS